MEMSTISIKVMLPMLRIQIRSPPPPSKVPRSGAIVIDLHNIEARINPSGSSQARRAHFTVPEPAHESSQASAQDSDDLVVICSSRILVSYSSYQQRHATGIVSLGPGSFVSTEETPAHPLFEHEDLPLRQLLRINLKQPKVGATRQQTRRTVVTVYLPSITATLAKPLVDGLQFFADDVSQLAARLMGGALPQTPQQVDSYEQSLIGSRFFARYGSRSASISDIDPSSISENLRSETVMKLDISQGERVLPFPWSQL
jgi:autophagy-related protein 2